MFSLDSITNENNKDHNKIWSYIQDHPYRMLIIGSSGSGKTDNKILKKKSKILKILWTRLIYMLKA